MKTQTTGKNSTSMKPELKKQLDRAAAFEEQLHGEKEYQEFRKHSAKASKAPKSPK